LFHRLVSLEFRLLSSSAVRSPAHSLVVLLAALGMAVLTARLGLWQLDRAAQKEALRASILQQGDLPPLEAAQLAHSAEVAASQMHRRIQLKGRWLHRFTVFLDNRQMGGRPGFFVVTPLELAPGDAVLVQRGWVPRDPQDRAHLPTLPATQEQVEMVARMAPPPSRLLEFAAEEIGPIRQNLDPGAYSREIGMALRPLSVLQLAPENASSRDELRRDWPLPAQDIQKHYGYAFQWFAMSLLIVGLYVWFQLVRPRLTQRAG
jgi:surfeit locus 1 family protein